MKKAVFGAILASLLMLSMPVVSTVNAGPQLIAKNSSERYVPEFVKAMVQELRSIVDRTMELAGDNETIIKQCRELYDVLDDIENGRKPALTPISGPSNEDVLAMITELDGAIRENYGDDVADEIISQVDKELNPLFTPIFGKDFSASEFILGGSIKDRESELAISGAIPYYPGVGIPVDDGRPHAYVGGVSAAYTVSSDGTISTTDTSADCEHYLGAFLFGIAMDVLLYATITALVYELGITGPLLSAFLGVEIAVILAEMISFGFLAATALQSFIDAGCLEWR